MKEVLASLVLLLITYAVFGWYWFADVVLIQETLTLRNLFLGGLAGTIVFLAALMTGPLHFLRSWILMWFKSDVRSFLTTVVASFVGVLLLVHLHMVANALLLFSAMSLARLELQTHNFGEWQAFWILALLSLVGVAVGGLAYWEWLKV